MYTMNKTSLRLMEQIPQWIPLRAIALVSLIGVACLSSTLIMKPPAPPVIELSSHEDLTPDLNSISDLIKAIQAATRDALQGGAEPAFSKEEKAIWHQKNPCRSRNELQPLYTRRKFARDVAPNPQWKAVMREYEKLHRACIQQVGADLTGYFLTRSNRTGCKFVVGGIPPRAGLGNKILSQVSGMLYAVLTQRVFLIPAETGVADIMCEPFEGSSWVVDPHKQFTPEYTHHGVWTESIDFSAAVDNAENGSKSTAHSSIYGVFPNDPYQCQPGKRFFCDTDQQYYTQVTWIYVNGCLYWLPKLFAIPVFRPVLEALFPDKMALTHLLRSVMLPSDEVWKRIVQTDRAFLRNADRRVGIQVRYRDGEKMFQEKHDMVNKRVLQCAVENGILPGKETSSSQVTAEEKRSWNGSDTAPSQIGSPSVTTVFITSLFLSLNEFLTQTYTRNPPLTGEAIGLIQLTHDKEQAFSVEEDRQALAEIIGLSLSDYLFVTPLSTFGGLAQGYGALVPWFIQLRSKSKEACVRAQTADTCYQIPEFQYTCPHNSDVNGRWVLQVVPYLKDCLHVDARYGIQLITANN